MPFEKTKIRTVSDPTIVLADMDEDDAGLSLGFGTDYKTSKYYGYEYPYIIINERKFLKIEIVNLEIDCSNFLPTIHLTLMLSDTLFYAQQFPKDGDIVSVYMRSFNKVYKPIRNDYLITHVETSMYDEKNNYTLITISGVLNIKKIWVEQNKTFKGTSLDVIKKVASELELGFVTNIEDSMDDEMNWICDWKSYKDFIIHITNHSWKNEKSFYRTFIDIYYNVNFIEVEKQFDQSKEFDETLGIFQKNNLDSADPLIQNFEQPSKEMDLVFTNNAMVMDFSGKITNYELINNSSAISYSQGYGKKMYFYDHTLKTISEENVIEFNPLSTPGTEDTKIRLRGKIDETIEKDHLKNIWNGIQYSIPIGNVHQKYTLAYQQNYVNNKELEKMYLDIDVVAWNPAVIRMERIPVFIYISDNLKSVSNYMSKKEIEDNLKGNVEVDNMTGSSITIDRFISGFFIVDSFKIYYDLSYGKVVAKYRLTRREWGVPQDESVL